MHAPAEEFIKQINVPPIYNVFIVDEKTIWFYNVLNETLIIAHLDGGYVSIQPKYQGYYKVALDKLEDVLRSWSMKRETFIRL